MTSLIASRKFTMIISKLQGGFADGIAPGQGRRLFISWPPITSSKPLVFRFKLNG